MVEKEMKKLVAGIVAGGVVTGSVVGAVMSGMVNDLEESNDALTSEVEVLGTSVQTAQGQADASEEASKVLSERVDELSLNLVNLQTDLTARDAEVLDLTAQINTEIAQEDTASGEASGYVIDDVELGDAFTKTLRDDKVEFLMDTEITFDDEEYRVEEQILIGDSFKTFTSVDNDEFGSTVYVGTDVKDSIEYRYVFREVPDFEAVSVDETLDINLLGRDFELVGVDGDEITYSESQKTVAVIGDEVSGVKILNIGENSVLLQKGDETEVVEDGEEVDIDGTSVLIESIFYVDTSAERMVVLRTGDDLDVTVKDGEAMETFGEPDDDSDAQWVWSIDTEADSPYIGARLNQKMNDLDDEFAPLKAGEQVVLPNDFAAVTYVGTNDVEYNKLSMEFDSVDVSGEGYETVFVMDSASSNFVADGFNYDRLFVSGEDVFVKEDGEFKSVSDVSIEQDDDNNLELVFNPGSVKIGDVKVKLDYEALDITDVKYGGEFYAEHDADLVTYRGDIVYNVEDSVEDDELEMDVASERVTANVRVD